MKRQLSVVARVRAVKVMELKVRRECLAPVERSRLERGCINYDLHQLADDPSLFDVLRKLDEQGRFRGTLGNGALARV